jgi:hypothetical protein
LSRPYASRAFALALGLCASAARARADAVLGVSGEVLATAPRLEVRVSVSNRGDQPAASIEVVGEFLEQRRAARLAAPLGPGQSGAVVLDFDVSAAPPGVHALTLLLEHPLPGTPDAGGNPPLSSQRAWLLVALRASPAPAVRVVARPARIDVRGLLEVSVESADGSPHRVRLRALSARGLRLETGALDLAVPATGAAVTQLPIVRAGAPRGTRHGVLLVAESREGPPLRTTVAVASVDVAPDGSLLPRLRTPLLVLALLMLLVVIGVEVWRPRSPYPRA